MEYNNQFALSPTSLTVLTVPEELICPHCQTRLNEQSVPPPRKPKNKRLWVDAVQVLQLTQALAQKQLNGPSDLCSTSLVGGEAHQGSIAMQQCF